MTQQKLFLSLLLTFSAIVVKAQNLTSQSSSGNEPRRWSLAASFGGISQSEDRGDMCSDNDGNAFALTADYWLSRHAALTGGVYAEQLGIMTTLDADGIGPKNYWMAGFEAGAKYYPLPSKWIVQPFVGATVMANVLNLKTQRGTIHFRSNYGTGGTATVADYEVQCPAVSLSPKIGLDLHLLRDLSLTFAADYRWGLYGKSRATARFNEGMLMGQTQYMDCRIDRMVLSIGLKLDFPINTVTPSKVQNGILDILWMWISSKKG